MCVFNSPQHLQITHFACVCMKCRKGDLPPPNDEDQPAPKTFLRLFRNSQSKPPLPKTTPTSTNPGKSKKKESEATSGESTRSKVPAPQAPPPEGRAVMFVRRPGESTRDYLERIDIESKNRIVDGFKKERKKSDKRKKLVLYASYIAI